MVLDLIECRLPLTRPLIDLLGMVLLVRVNYVFIEITFKFERILTENIDENCRVDSKLKLSCLCSIKIRSRIEDF